MPVLVEDTVIHGAGWLVVGAGVVTSGGEIVGAVVVPEACVHAGCTTLRQKRAQQTQFYHYLPFFCSILINVNQSHKKNTR